MNNIYCPCCNNNIKDIGTVLLDNIKKPLDKSCVFCLCEMNSVHNFEQLVACPKCGNLFHNKCWFEYVAFKVNQMNHLLLIILMFIITLLSILIY